MRFCSTWRMPCLVIKFCNWRWACCRQMVARGIREVSSVPGKDSQMDFPSGLQRQRERERSYFKNLFFLGNIWPRAFGCQTRRRSLSESSHPGIRQHCQARPDHARRAHQGMFYYSQSQFSKMFKFVALLGQRTELSAPCLVCNPILECSCFG